MFMVKITGVVYLRLQLIHKCLQYRGLVSKETVVLRRWGSDTRKFGLSTPLINQIFVFTVQYMDATF